MGNEVGSVFGGSANVPDSAALAEALRKSADNNPRSGGGGNGTFLNFSGKSGRYTVGTDGKDMNLDATLLVNIAGFEDGYICWKGGKPRATRLAGLGQPPVQEPDADELGPFDGNADGWSVLKTMTLKDVDTGEQFYFKINSISGVSVFAELIDEVASRAGRGDPAWPVLSLGSESFTAGGYKNFKPILEVYGWLSDDVLGKVGDADLDELIAESSGGTKELAPPEGDEKVDEKEPEEKTTRRRRRSL